MALVPHHTEILQLRASLEALILPFGGTATRLPIARMGHDEETGEGVVVFSARRTPTPASLDAAERRVRGYLNRRHRRRGLAGSSFGAIQLVVDELDAWQATAAPLQVVTQIYLIATQEARETPAVVALRERRMTAQRACGAVPQAPAQAALYDQRLHAEHRRLLDQETALEAEFTCHVQDRLLAFRRSTVCSL
jgi:hypothetical protein